MEIIILN